MKKRVHFKYIINNKIAKKNTNLKNIQCQCDTDDDCYDVCAW